MAELIIKKIFEFLKKKGREKDVADLIRIDIDKHMREIMRLNNNVAALTSADNNQKLNEILDNLETFSNFYSDKELNNLSKAFNLLPGKCYKKIKDFYGETKILHDSLKKKLKTNDYRQVYKSWASLCPQTYAIGLKSLICLMNNVLKDKEGAQEIKQILDNHLKTFNIS